MQIIEAAHQPGEIADAVAIGIHITADREAVDHRVLVPQVVDHSALPRTGAPSRANAAAFCSSLWVPAAAGELNKLGQRSATPPLFGKRLQLDPRGDSRL